MTTIGVHIDRVVLDGIDLAPGQARALGEALEAELARLLTASRPGAWRESRHTRRIDGPALRLGGHPTVSSLGRQIAREIARCAGAGPHTSGGAR